MKTGWFWLSVAGLTALATVRIVATFGDFSQSFDEPYHIAAGMQWLEKGVYVFERLHPPLARIAIALPLYLQGVRGHSQTSFPSNEDGTPVNVGVEMLHNGNQILASQGPDRYQHILFWARAGNLPFFWLSVWVLALWSRRWFGWKVALATVAIYTLLPQVLGNAGVATTDMAAAAGFLVALYAFSCWIESPSLRSSAGLGAGVGFSAVCKFSTIPFLVVGLVLMLIWAGASATLRLNWTRLARFAAVALLAALLVIWLPYRFHSAPLLTGHGLPIPTQKLGPLKPLADKALNMPIPLGEFFGGLGAVFMMNKLGPPSYLLGQVRMGGFLAFFPVVLAVKTPLSLLLGLLLALSAAAGWLFRQKNIQKAIPVVFAVGIFVMVLTALINLGVRHILPLLPLLALITVLGWMDTRMWLAGKAFWGRSAWPRTIWLGLTALLFVGLITESASAHPDYLPWFNALAGPHPEKIVVGGDLDWGQDLLRLEKRLHARGITHVKIAYFGSADLHNRSIAYEDLQPDQRVTGWIAASMMNVVVGCIRNQEYCWLREQTPVERVGTSIYLYYVPEAAQGNAKDPSPR